MLLIGIDDAGRGPIIGPMILAGVLIKEEIQSALKEEGVADSKVVAHPERIRLSGIIRDICINYKVVMSFPEQIDHSINSGINLNTLEAIKAAEIINFLAQGIKEKIKVIVDCPSPNTSVWKMTLLSFIKNPQALNIICEHKADANYPSVSAASILAKVAREEEVGKLKLKYGNIGSGYLTDPVTLEFLKKQGLFYKDSGIFRKTWTTWNENLAEKEQKKLLDF